MNHELNIKLYAVTVDCKNPPALAEFYAKLLCWEIAYQDENYACVGAPNAAQGAYPGITFQREPAYLPPVWPSESEKQQQMTHLDFIVNDLEQAVAHAIRCGARQADQQFSDGWRVMLDPEGHPFCLCLMKEVMESPDFGLK